MRGVDPVEMAKVTGKDQITMLINPTMEALRQVQEAFEGEAARLGLEAEVDAARMMSGFRVERQEHPPGTGFDSAAR